jgi:SAM-dependent methyltransferase
MSKPRSAISTLKQLVPGRVKKAIRLMIHRGNKYTCPICGYGSKDLLPIGVDVPVITEKQIVGAGLRYGRCHKCGSTDRERLLYTFLKEKENLFDGDKKISILHIAPERKLTQVLLKAGFENYVCGDLFTEGYQYQEHVQNMNVLNLPFEDSTFDLLICNHVLEHIPNDTDAMTEIYRVLKENGKAILQVPISKNTEATREDASITSPEQREAVFGQFDHVRIYGQDYSERLESTGFKVERVNISEEFKHFGLNIDEDIFIGFK